MKKSKINKIIFTAAIIISISLISYFTYTYYLLSDGFRDYKDYCSTFIPLIEKHHEETGQYPKSLNELEETNDLFNRYEPSECGYYIGDNGYGFSAPAGFGVVMYFSDKDLWVYD